MRSSWALVLALVAGGCNNEYCARQTDCAANQMCSIEGKCVMATSGDDAGGSDGTTPVPDAAIDAAPDAAPDAATDAAIDGGM